MKSETPPPPTPSAEAHWVEGELVRGLMRTQRQAQWLSLVLIAVIGGVLWGDLPPVYMTCWVLLAAGVIVARWWMLREYDRHVLQQGTEEHLAFFRRFRLFWPGSAVVWCLTTFLYFDRSSLADQFICWLTLAGLSMIAVNSLSSQLATLRAFLDTMTATALGIVGWRMVVQLHLHGPTYHW